EQFRKRDARQAGTDGLVKSILERAVGQLHPDDQVAVDHPKIENDDQVGMANVLDERQGTLLDGGGLTLEGDKLERDMDVPRSAGLPDRAAAALATLFHQAKARQRFHPGCQIQCHGYRSSGCERFRPWRLWKNRDSAIDDNCTAGATARSNIA